MAVITKLKVQKNKKRVNVFLNNKFSFSLSLEEVYKNHLSVGQELTDKQIKKLFLESYWEQLYFKVLNFLSYRPRSEKEINTYLAKNLAKNNLLTPDLKEKIKAKITKKLKQKKLIDDYQFSLWWLEQRLTFKPRGKRLIKQELWQKGINKEIIASVLAATTNKQFVILAKKIIAKKLALYKNLPKLKLKQKLFNLLKQRGFDWEIIKSVVDETLLKL